MGALDSQDSRGAAPAGSRFEMQDHVHSGRHTLVLSGELDVASAGELEAMVARICVDGLDALVLDLSPLAAMDSSGVRAVAFAHRSCQDNGYEFRIIPGGGAVQRLFELSGLVDVLPFEDPSPEAPRARARFIRDRSRSVQ